MNASSESGLWATEISRLAFKTADSELLVLTADVSPFNKNPLKPICLLLPPQAIESVRHGRGSHNFQRIPGQKGKYCQPESCAG